ncbi:hypothetical protein QAD02_000009 [Eretmocerus hayati]|uniref:Uncharacterized protein n=1 Tax=Eretmocerus hayati TaxID=131215 RepID=A0ACC2NC63_9HYME|nr:hypothetical protein QAD02_000009 [Eretmocerus hayati]
MTASRPIGIFTHETENLSKVSKIFLIKPDSVLDTLGHCLRVIWAEKKAGQDHDHHVFLTCLLQAVSRASLSTTVSGQGPPGNPGVTPLDEMFTGFQETTITCMECQNQVTKSRHFLELEIHPSDTTTVINSLEKRFATKSITRYCTACVKQTENKMMESLGEAPQILRLNLKGGTSCAEQSLVHDSFVDGLDLTPFEGRSRSSTTGGLRYELCSVLTQLDDHYQVFARVPSGDLYVFEDSNVSINSSESETDPQGYG